MPAKTPVHSTTSENPATQEPPKAEAATSSTSTTRNKTASVFVLLAVCVIVAAVVMAVRNGSEPVEVAAADAKVTAASPAAAQPNAPAAPKVKPPARAAAESAAANPSASAAPESSSALSATVTITGCLERSEKGYRLKNTSGADAPKSRSWKTGFFAKRSASIEVSDHRGSSHLAEHLGERVSLTGALIDREMIVHSLRSLAASCK